MSQIGRFWSRLIVSVRHARVELGLAFRVTVAAVSALALAQHFDFRLPLWTVMTAIVVTQMSLGRSLKATSDYLIGTLGGAVYGGAVAALVPHATEPALLLVLAVAVAPLAFAAALNPTLTVAPVTAVIVLLVPEFTHASPMASAFERMLEVGAGGLVGLLVSFALLPSSAIGLAVETAARTLELMAEVVDELRAGLERGLDADAVLRVQRSIGLSLAHLGTVAAEAERERFAHLAVAPDTRPLSRTLLRLRHDLVMVGRAAAEPLPEAFRVRLEGLLIEIGKSAADYLRGSAAALLERRSCPPLAAIEAALAAYAVETGALRGEGLTLTLPIEAAERFFALGFAFDQMRHNLHDLDRCVAEWADSRTSGTVRVSASRAQPSAAHDAPPTDAQPPSQERPGSAK